MKWACVCCFYFLRYRLSVVVHWAKQAFELFCAERTRREGKGGEEDERWARTTSNRKKFNCMIMFIAWLGDLQIMLFFLSNLILNLDQSHKLAVVESLKISIWWTMYCLVLIIANIVCTPPLIYIQLWRSFYSSQYKDY